MPRFHGFIAKTNLGLFVPKCKNQKSAKKSGLTLSLSGFYPNFTIIKERARALDERHTRKEKHAFFFPLSISRLKRLDSKSSITTQTTTT